MVSRFDHSRSTHFSTCLGRYKNNPPPCRHHEGMALPTGEDVWNCSCRPTPSSGIRSSDVHRAWGIGCRITYSGQPSQPKADQRSIRHRQAARGQMRPPRPRKAMKRMMMIKMTTTVPIPIYMLILFPPKSDSNNPVARQQTKTRPAAARS